MYRWCHIIALETALTSWKFTAPKTAHRMPVGCHADQPGCSSSCERQMKVLSFKLGYITIKNEVRNQVCSQSKMETMEKNKLRLFCSPLSGPNFQARNLELVTQPNGPSASAILRFHPSKFAWTPHGRSWKISFLPHSCHIWQFRWGFLVCNHLQSSPPNP